MLDKIYKGKLSGWHRLRDKEPFLKRATMYIDKIESWAAQQLKQSSLRSKVYPSGMLPVNIDVSKLSLEAFELLHKIAIYEAMKKKNFKGFPCLGIILFMKTSSGRYKV